MAQVDTHSPNQIPTKEVCILIPEKPGVDASYCQEAITAALYHNGIMTMRDAHLLLKMTRREFEETILPKFGYTPMDNCPGAAETEAKAGSW